MPRVRLVHWNAGEAEKVLARLRGAGYIVDYNEKFSSRDFRGIRRAPPDAVVIDLSRLPSRGREAAVYLRGLKSTRHIPIVFLGGAPETVAALCALLPDARFAGESNLPSILRAALKSRPAEPIVPPQIMDRYRARTTAQKLGIEAGSSIAIIDPPRNYGAVLGALPDDVTMEEDPADCPVTLWFVHDGAALAAALRPMRAQAAHTKLWILWRKGGAVTQHTVRQSAAAVGLVDYKICSVDAVWSAMLFARKRV